jgi:glycosyltransferase involved in cell wall biosynthesis
MQQNLTISVLMPVYNAERYIAVAVESILNQSFTDFEFIIINDGSTDRSLDILQQYAQKDKRIRLISRENKGLVKTLNEGLALAKAPLIARMDADDIAVTERFALQKDFMGNNPDYVCVGGRVRVIDEKDRFLIIADTKLDHEEIELSALQGITPICHPTAMLRKEKIDLIGGYQECDYPAEDLGLFLNLSEIGKLGNLKDVVLEYRIHNHSISTSTNELQLQKSREICERHWKKRGREYSFLALEGRPGATRGSKFDITLKHGWWAFNNKQWKTAAIYGTKSIAINPFNQGGWRLLICALIKRPK